MVTKITETKGRTTGGEYAITTYECNGCNNRYNTMEAAIKCERDCEKELREAEERFENEQDAGLKRYYDRND